MGVCAHPQAPDASITLLDRNGEHARTVLVAIYRLSAQVISRAEGRSVTAAVAYRAALMQMLAQTDTRWAPWSMIDANDSGAAQIAALTAIAEALEKALPQAPPEAASSVVPFMASSDRVQPVG